MISTTTERQADARRGNPELPPPPPAIEHRTSGRTAGRNHDDRPPICAPKLTYAPLSDPQVPSPAQRPRLDCRRRAHTWSTGRDAASTTGSRGRPLENATLATYPAELHDQGRAPATAASAVGRSVLPRRASPVNGPHGSWSATAGRLGDRGASTSAGGPPDPPDPARGPAAAEAGNSRPRLL